MTRHTTRNAGVTLLEMMIVILVIAMILTIVISGRSVMRQAQQDSFVRTVQRLEESIWNFYDENVPKRLPGDTNLAPNGDGVIDGATQAATELETAGYYGPDPGTGIVRLGYVQVSITNDGAGKNIIRAQNVPIAWARSLDAKVDGRADGTTGRVLYATPSPPDDRTDLSYYFDEP